jgi:hypothetical protein
MNEHTTIPDALSRFAEAHELAGEVIRLDAAIEDLKAQLKTRKDLREQLVQRLVAVTGGERQTTIMDCEQGNEE